MIAQCITDTLARSFPADPSTWSLADAKKWLQAHSIDLPAGATQQQALKLVQDNLDAVAKRGARGAGAAQAYYEAITEKTIDAWTESQLREYLLEHGIISPSGTLEEMRIAAKQR